MATERRFLLLFGRRRKKGLLQSFIKFTELFFVGRIARITGSIFTNLLFPRRLYLDLLTKPSFGRTQADIEKIHGCIFTYFPKVPGSEECRSPGKRSNHRS